MKSKYQTIAVKIKGSPGTGKMRVVLMIQEMLEKEGWEFKPFKEGLYVVNLTGKQTR